jgi:hypothetical protein
MLIGEFQLKLFAKGAPRGVQVVALIGDLVNDEFVVRTAKAGFTSCPGHLVSPNLFDRIIVESSLNGYDSNLSDT